jgi:hypothetical protein
MQAPLALVSLCAGTVDALMGAGIGWGIAAALIGAVVPFTAFGIMPTNHSLLEPGRELDSAETRALLVRWGQLHAVRTALSVASTILYLYLLTSI